MEAIGRMMGGVAHDFNNVLAVIRSAAELIRRRPEDPRREFFLDSIVQATERGAKLTRQLLSFAGRRAAQPEVVDLAERVAAIGELVRSSLRADIELRLELAPGLWPVEADPAELELALLNLASNARDAMPDGGTLRLSAGNVTLPRAGEDVVPALAGDHVRLAVTDTGTGMAPDVAERAFEPFYTTKERGKGTGLGLSQVYGFARQAGGTAVVRSRPGEGTGVVIYLPRTRKTPAIAAAPSAERAAARSLRVLVVEDDRAVTSGAAALLRELGHVPTLAERADEALERLADGSRFDLVFSDVVMPGGMDGVQLAHEIRRRHPGTPVLLATGYALRLEEGAGAPADVRVLRKPYGLEALAGAIEESVRRAEGVAAAQPSKSTVVG
jgi:CheY-like chemotaxis protein